MKIKTKYFGDFEVKEKEILTFPNGLFGFEGSKDFTVIPFDEAGESSFFCLQSVDDENLAFVLFSPFFVNPEYAPQITAEDMADMDIGEKTSVTLLSITVVRGSLAESTVNLKCPIVINNDTGRAKQVILENDYSMRCPIGSVKKEG